MAKQLVYSGTARQKLFAGAEKLASAVRVTLGPKGRNVVLEKKWGPPVVTNDGVTIAKEIEIDKPFENMGDRLLKEVATRTNDVAAGINPMEIKRGLEHAVEIAVESI